METDLPSVEAKSEDIPSDGEQTVARMREAQHQQFDHYVEKESVTNPTETPATSLKEILQNRPDYMESPLTPEAVFKASIKAAEQDVPLEGQLERRHERKDEDFQPSDGLTSVGGGPAMSPHDFLAPGISDQPMVPVHPPGSNLAQDAMTNIVRFAQKPRSPYRQAVYGGIAAAIVALLVFGLTLLIR